MSPRLIPKLVGNTPCCSQDVAKDYADYPDSGFDLTDDYAETSFRVRSRNRLFKWPVRREQTRPDNAKPARAADQSDALAVRVTVPPLLSWLFNKVIYLDAVMIKLGISRAFGGTFAVAARKSVT